MAWKLRGRKKEGREPEGSDVSRASRAEGMRGERRSGCNQVLSQHIQHPSVQKSQLSHWEGLCSYFTPSTALPMK